VYGKAEISLFSGRLLLITMAVLLCWPLTTAAASGLKNEVDELNLKDVSQQGYHRMVDQQGKVIMQTGHRLTVGDQYLTVDNRLYEVFKIEGRTAHARYLKTDKMTSAAISATSPSALVQAEPNYCIAIFHTHNDESYVPTDGTHSIEGEGGIHRVGAAFKRALEAKGINAIYSDDLHLPHDQGAYHRSRETAIGLVVKHEPDAIFDLHRDAAPWNEYAVRVKGNWAAKIMFVVGRQNPHVYVNRRFAYDLKNFSDRVYPGLVKGVLFAHANYNQDLHPLFLLLEVGAHENSRGAAERGIEFFADVIGYYLYGPETRLPEDSLSRRVDDTPVWRNILWVILLVTAAGVSFYLLNNPQAALRWREKIKRYLPKI
jgi:stage II sporulation protein P